MPVFNSIFPGQINFYDSISFFRLFVYYKYFLCGLSVPVHASQCTAGFQK
jgi:hypothetical protein